jgi:hypothetical protein
MSFGINPADACRDGLHLTPEGYKVVFSMVKDKIEHAFPELTPDKMPSCIPDYGEYGLDGEDDLIRQCQEEYRKTRSTA